MLQKSISKKAGENPSAGPTTDGLPKKSRNRSESIPDGSLFHQDKPKKRSSQTEKSGQKVKHAKPASKDKTYIPPIEFGLVMLQSIKGKGNKALVVAVNQALVTIRQYSTVISLISGACAYELTKDIDIPTGSRHPDIEGKGKLAEYERVGKELGIPSRTVEDNTRIYRYCIAEPVAAIDGISQQAKREADLLKKAVSLPRSFLIKAATVFKSDEAVEIAEDRIRGFGRKNYTLAKFAEDIGDFERRNKTAEGGTPGADDDQEGLPPNSSGGEPKPVRRSIKLSEKAKDCLNKISEEIGFSPDEAINLALIYCCEHLEEFAASPEVSAI